MYVDGIDDDDDWCWDDDDDDCVGVFVGGLEFCVLCDVVINLCGFGGLILCLGFDVFVYVKWCEKCVCESVLLFLFDVEDDVGEVCVRCGVEGESRG